MHFKLKENSSTPSNNNNHPHNQPIFSPTKKFQRKYIDDNLENLELICILAAKYGDNLILKLLLDPTPPDEEEVNLKTRLNEYKEKKAKLQRRVKIRKTQMEILLDYYRKYGARILAQENYDRYLFSVLHPVAFEKLLESRKILNAKDFTIDKDLTQLLDVLANFYFAVSVNIFDDINNINRELSAALDNLLYSLRLENREMLSKTTQIIINGKLTFVNLALRVKLHREFSLSLLDQFKELHIEVKGIDDIKEHFQIKPFGFKDAFEYYQILAKDEADIYQQLQDLQKSYQDVIQKVHLIELNRKLDNQKHLIEKNNIVQALFNDAFFRALSLDKNRKIRQLAHKQIPVSFREDNTENNLLHIALEAGQFETALFLIKRRVDCLAQNKKNISAIDAQDVLGNTLLHYLAHKGRFAEAYEIILIGSNFMIPNKKGETVLDIVSNQKTLIHFLLLKINCDHPDPKALATLKYILSQNLKLSLLTAKNYLNQNVYTIILKLPKNDHREAILTAVIKGNRDQKFSSRLQRVINAAIWVHFGKLRDLDKTPLFAQKFLGANNKLIDKHLHFLQQLQAKLLEANKKKSDEELVEFLTQQLQNISLTSDLKAKYQNILKHVAEIKQMSLHRPISEKEFYYLPSQPKIESSYQLIANAGVTIPGEISKSPLKRSGSQLTLYASPLQKGTRRDLQEKKQDPAQWFSSTKYNRS